MKTGMGFIRAAVCLALLITAGLAPGTGVGDAWASASQPDLPYLASRLHQHQGLFFMAPVGYLTLDRRGRIVEANATAAYMLGMEWKGLLTSSLEGFVTPASRGVLADQQQAARERGCKQAVELKLVRMGGGEFTCLVESACVFDRAGNLVGYRMIIAQAAPLGRGA